MRLQPGDGGGHLGLEVELGAADVEAAGRHGLEGLGGHVAEALDVGAQGRVVAGVGDEADLPRGHELRAFAAAAE